METSNQKRRRIFGKQSLPKYLQEINKLVNFNIDSGQILSITETDKIARRSRGNLFFQENLLFDNKLELIHLVKEKFIDVDETYYIFITYTLDCGTVNIGQLENFNFGFAFNDVDSGIINLVSERNHNELILDFYEENGIKYLKVEIYKNG